MKYLAELASLGIILLEFCLIDLTRDSGGCRPCRQQSLKLLQPLDIEEVVGGEVDLDEGEEELR